LTSDEWDGSRATLLLSAWNMIRKRLLLGLVALALLVVGGVERGSYLWRWIQVLRYARTAAARAPGAMDAWRQAYGDPEAAVAQFTRAKDNATAQRLVALATPLGIALEDPSHASLDFPEANAIGSYVSTDGDVAMPPASVRTYLEAQQRDRVGRTGTRISVGAMYQPRCGTDGSGARGKASES
jgi:hypothetical protein